MEYNSRQTAEDLMKQAGKKTRSRCGTEMGVSLTTRNLHALAISFDKINQSHSEASGWQIWIWIVFIPDL